MLNFLGSAGARRKTVRALYDQLVTRSRAPVFYAKLGVPDTIDGRFDMLALHAFLLLERLREAGASELSQGVMDSLFIGMDEGLRDLGAGDMGIGRKMKSLANAFYGRMMAYGEASDEKALVQAIQRNIYREKPGGENASVTLAAYAFAARAKLKNVDVAKGEVDFGSLPQA